MNGDGHHINLSDLDGLSAQDTQIVVLRELRGLRNAFDEQAERMSERMLQMSKEIDRLRLRIKQPHLEELNKHQAAEALGVSTRTIGTYARSWREGDRMGLEHFYRPGRSGREFYTTMAHVEAFKRKNKILD